MTPAAEKDIRSALRQLRGCRGRLAMLTTALHNGPEKVWLDFARANAGLLEQQLKTILGLDQARRDVAAFVAAGSTKR